METCLQKARPWKAQDFEWTGFGLGQSWVLTVCSLRMVGRVCACGVTEGLRTADPVCACGVTEGLRTADPVCACGVTESLVLGQQTQCVHVA